MQYCIVIGFSAVVSNDGGGVVGRETRVGEEKNLRAALIDGCCYSKKHRPNKSPLDGVGEGQKKIFGRHVEKRTGCVGSFTLRPPGSITPSVSPSLPPLPDRHGKGLTGVIAP